MDHTQRRFSLSDVMILVVAAALSFAVYGFMGPEWDVYELVTLNNPDFSSARFWGRGFMSFLPYVGVFTFVLIFMRTKKPRPPVGVLCEEPGFVATFMAGSVLLGGTLAFVINCLLSRKNIPWFFHLARWHYGVPGYAGWAVAGAWALLKCGGRWRPETDWLDRAGRLMGIFWIGWSLIGIYLQSLVAQL